MSRCDILTGRAIYRDRAFLPGRSTISPRSPVSVLHQRRSIIPFEFPHVQKMHTSQGSFVAVIFIVLYLKVHVTYAPVKAAVAVEI